MSLVEQVSRRRRQTQDRLLDAAFEVLAREGVDGASVEAICEAAGFTRGAFYSNFDTKTELFLALVEREHGRWLERLREHVRQLRTEDAGGELSVDRIAGIVEDVLAKQPSSRDWYLISMQFEVLALREPEVAPRLLAFERQLVAELATVVEDVAGRLGQRLVVDAEDVAALFIAGYEAAAKQALLTDAPDHAAEVRRVVGRWLPAVAARLVEPLS